MESLSVSILLDTCWCTWCSKKRNIFSPSFSSIFYFTFYFFFANNTEKGREFCYILSLVYGILVSFLASKEEIEVDKEKSSRLYLSGDIILCSCDCQVALVEGRIGKLVQIQHSRATVTSESFSSLCHCLSWMGRLGKWRWELGVRRPAWLIQLMVLRVRGASAGNSSVIFRSAYFLPSVSSSSSNKTRALLGNGFVCSEHFFFALRWE